MNAFSYLSNAKKLGKNPSLAYGSLISEFEKGNVSYPRSDSINHIGIKVLSKKVNPEVKSILEYKDNFDNYPTIYNYVEKYMLSSPASVAKDVDEARKFLLSNPALDNIDINVGLIEHKHFVDSKKSIHGNDFNFMEFISDVYGNDEIEFQTNKR
jgi:hypothetical protein